jgi:hypothetical protein
VAHLLSNNRVSAWNSKELMKNHKINERTTKEKHSGYYCFKGGRMGCPPNSFGLFWRMNRITVVARATEREANACKREQRITMQQCNNTLDYCILERKWLTASSW